VSKIEESGAILVIGVMDVREALVVALTDDNYEKDNASAVFFIIYSFAFTFRMLFMLVVNCLPIEF